MAEPGRKERLPVKIRFSSAAAAVLAALALSACGGSSSAPPTPPVSDGTISGAVVDGPVGGASVRAYAVSGGTMGAQVGGGTTDAMGNFTVSIGSYSGPLMLQASGGSYVDEATGAVMTMQAGDEMACAIPAVAAGAATTGVQITPLTSMAHARAHHMAGGITAASITAANAAVGAYFSAGDILHTAPMNPLVAGAGAGASADARNAGMAIAAMSQYAQSIGMTSSSGIVTAMMDDASDGVMDGRMSGATIAMGGGMMGGTMMAATAGTSGLAGAMAAFVGSARNASGVTAADMTALMTQLDGSTGQLPGAGGASTVGMISGAAAAGPVAGGTVTAYAVSGGMVGAQLGTALTDDSGHFAVPVGSYAGPVMLQLSGGTYLDEATGTRMPMLAGDAMGACLDAVAAGATTTDVQVTPLTSMAWARARSMTGGMTPANILAANAAVGAYFSVGDLLHTAPMDATAAGSGAAATQDMKDAGMALAAMSQYALALGMTSSSSGVITAMMDDASDGVMDGMMGSAPISMAGMGGMMGGTMQAHAGTTGLATAMSDFIGSARNLSGVSVADMAALMTQLAGSSGQLPGAGGAVTPHGMVSGTAFMGAVSGGTMTAYAVSGGTMGPPLGASAVDASGRFTIPLGAYAGGVMLQLGGATYLDAATGTPMTAQAGDVLTACLPAVAAGSTTTGVQVTPLTSMAQAMAQGLPGGMTAANVTAANAGVGSYFMVGDILMTAPIDPALAGSGAGASPDGKDYGMSIAAMSKYAATVGMTSSSSGMFAAMTKDASDGVMNGMMGTTSIAMGGMGGGMMGGGSMMPATAGTAGLSTAMTAFLGSAMNRSGLTAADMMTLVGKLAASSGKIP